MSGERNEEIVIVGGGPAGASAACILADAGRSALLIERDPEPRHKVCGEFLSIEAQTYLAHLGIDLDRLRASRIARIRLAHGRHSTEADLPFLSRGLSRKILDEALLQQAMSRGAEILRGVTVKAISPEGTGIHLDADTHSEIQTETLFLASGKHDVRGAKRPAAGTMNDLIGFKGHYRLAQAQQIALEGCVEVILFTGGYAGLQLVEDGIANLCLVVTRQCFDDIGKSWGGLLDRIAHECPHLGERMEGAEPLFERPLSIFQIPYGYLHVPAPREPQSLFRVGDQAAVIPSFTGDGMSIALHSGCLAASTFLAQGQASSIFHRRLREDIQRSLRLASALNTTVRYRLGRQAVFHLCRAWPAAMRHMTSLTRVQETSMALVAR
ncbi:NAD(P)/FAD-dependent oxidoreductase [Microvirga sp. VF16]|uniref:NAD(P)/FAD-dependent oxidoreductase n=1 Tax=Microvirga sp. VF16 TaxID=2807101 RepID=UPI00193D5556|nr:FAD-dependent oxidoreductase [Microvirga sp. VF16]QRM27559.1 NAD-binding protein [Microvirga sp. VF16]